MYLIKSGHKTATIPTVDELCEFWNQHHPFKVNDVDEQDETDYLKLMESIKGKKRRKKNERNN